MAESDFFERVSGIVRENIQDEQFDVEMLARMLQISRSQLFRKLKSAQNMSPVQFIAEMRCQMALTLIKSPGSRNISSIAYQCGFKQPGYFSRVIKKRFQKTPSALKREK